MIVGATLWSLVPLAMSFLWNIIFSFIIQNNPNIGLTLVSRHTTRAQVGLGLCCLMTPGLSKDINSGVMYDYTFAKVENHQIRHQATHSGLPAWWLHVVTLIFLSGLHGYVWVIILISLPPRIQPGSHKCKCPKNLTDVITCCLLLKITLIPNEYL